MAAAVERALRHERAAVRAWLHDRPLQMLELIAAGGYDDEIDPERLRDFAARAADELRAFIEGDADAAGDGLVAALREVVADAELLAVSLGHELEIGRMDGDVAADHVRHLAAATAEALTNVRKHAKASHVVVACEVTRDEVVVTIQDDGVGIALERLALGTGVRRSLRDRMRRCGGRAQLESRPGGGTRVTLRAGAAASAASPRSAVS
jgi:signal transduction histidine kinase